MPSTSSPAADTGAVRQARRDRVARLDRLATQLDTKFRLPVLNIPVGWDSILGLIPGVGDAATALPGVAMIYEANRMGARKRAQVRMAANTGIDLAIGTIPLVGDAFDLFFKSHRRNIRILKDELARIDTREDKEDDTWQSAKDQTTATTERPMEMKVPLGSRAGLAANSSATSPHRTNSDVPPSARPAKRG